MTTADYMVIAEAATLLALFVVLLWPTKHTCDERFCPHQSKRKE